MKKTILSSATLLCSILIFLISISCNQIPGNKEENKSDSFNKAIVAQQIPLGEKWLKSIFQCPNSNGYCFPDEGKVFTEQYLEFYLEELEIFEYPYFETEEEQAVAEKAYESKWKDTYPLGKPFWAPFGRGNGIGTGDKLENVTITHLSDLIYTALIDYGGEAVFFNGLLLVPSGDAFLIDYIETALIELQEGETNLPFLQNLTLAKFQLGANPSDAKRLLGKPQSEFTDEGPLEVSGYIDEDYIVTSTTMEFDGIQLVYQDDSMVHVFINKPGKSFGWIVCGDNNCNRDYLIKKFKLTEDNFYENDEGGKMIVMNWEIFSLVVLLDKNEMVKTIEMNTGP